MGLNNSLRNVLICLVAWIMILDISGFSQEDAEVPKETVSESAQLPEKSSSIPDNSSKIPKIKETIIIFPDSEMHHIIQDNKEGIFLPFKEYKSLFEKAKTQYLKNISKTETETETARISQASYKGILKENLISFTAIFKIIKKTSGYCKLPVPLKGVLYNHASLKNTSTHLFYNYNDNIPEIVLLEKGSFDLLLEFDVPLNFDGTKAVVTFNIPRVLLGEVKILADEFSDIQFIDLSFASRQKVDKYFEYFGFIGGKDDLSFKINRKHTFGNQELKLFSIEKQVLVIKSHVVEITTDYQLDIQDGDIKTLDILIPKEIEIYDIKGEGIASWNRNRYEKHDSIVVTFSVPKRGQTQFSIISYQYIDALNNSSQAYVIKDITIKNLFKRTGNLLIYTANDLNIEIENESNLLHSLDKTSISDSSQASQLQKLHGIYQIFNLPFEVRFYYREKSLKHIDIAAQFLVFTPSKAVFHSTIRSKGSIKAGTYFPFSYPFGFKIKKVTSRIKQKEIPVFFEEFPENNVLNVEVRYPPGAGDEIIFTFDAEYLYPDQFWNNLSLELTIPNIFQKDAKTLTGNALKTSIDTKGNDSGEKTTGNLSIHMDESILLEDISMTGYMPIEEKVLDVQTNTDSLISQKHMYYEFKNTHAKGKIKFSKKKPEISAETVNFLTIQEDRLNIQGHIKYFIANGAIKQFFVALPKCEDNALNIKGSDIKEKNKLSSQTIEKVIDQKNQVDNSLFDIWHIELQTEKTGEYLLEIEYIKKIRSKGGFDSVLMVKPLFLKNDTGYIVIETGKSLDINIQKSGLSEVESYELPKWPVYKTYGRTIESLKYFSDHYALKIKIQKKEELPVLSAIAEYENITYTLAENSDIFFEYIYHIRNTNLQFLKIKLADHLILWSAKINGKGIKPRKVEDELSIPLDQIADNNINLTLTGVCPNSSTIFPIKSFLLEGAKLDIPCLKSQIQIYYPELFSIVQIDGNFEDIVGLPFESPLPFTVYQHIKTLLKGLSEIGISYRKAEAPSTQREMTGKSFMEKSNGKFDKEPSQKPKEAVPQKTMPAPAAPVSPSSSDIKTSIIKEKEETKKPQILAEPVYAKQKGILSLDFEIPKTGKTIMMTKLWGNSFFKLKMLPPEWKRTITIFSAIFILVAGFLFIYKQVISAFFFFVISVIISICLPNIGFKGFIFILNILVYGSFLLWIFFTGKRLYTKIISAKTSR